jgi:tyrosine-protein kinase Etk/Wzc
VPYYFLDKPLTLQFKQNQFSLSYKDSIVAEGHLNQDNLLTTNKGQWKIRINSTTPFKHAFKITKFALPTAVKKFN